MSCSPEMKARLQRSPIAKLGQIILEGIHLGKPVSLTSLEELSRNTDLQAVEVLSNSDRYQSITIHNSYYGEVQCTWLNREKAAEEGVLVYFHGGGFVAGVMGSQWRWISELVLSTNKAAAVLHYTKFPTTCSHDMMTKQCLSVLTTMYQSGDLYGNWSIAGDSSGGSLVLSLLGELSKNTDLVFAPRGVLLMSPWTNRQDWPNYEDASNFKDLVLDVRWLNWMSSQLDHTAPVISWSNLKMLGVEFFILSGSREVFLPATRALKREIDGAGVTCLYHEEREVVHAYPLFVGDKQANKAIAQQARWLRSLPN